LTLFFISGVVGLLGAWFTNEYAARLSGEGQENAQPVYVPPGLVKEVFQTWAERITDTASNLPATVLTAVAYSELSLSSAPKSAKPFFASVIILTVVVVAIAAVVTSKPKRHPLRLVASISLWSWGLILANLIGLCLTFARW
jgi:hypothetical protein